MLALVFLPALAFADVGKISVLEGSATRAAKGAKAEQLKVGSGVQLDDTLKVAKGNLKFELNDGSVIALAEGSELAINKAEFQGQERSGEGFFGFLKAGKLWTIVK